MALHGLTTNKIFVGPLNSVMSAAAVVPALCNRSALQIPPAYLSFLSHTGSMHILPKKSIPSTNIELKQHNFDPLKMWYLYLITRYGTFNGCYDHLPLFAPIINKASIKQFTINFLHRCCNMTSLMVLRALDICLKRDMGQRFFE